MSMQNFSCGLPERWACTVGLQYGQNQKGSRRTDLSRNNRIGTGLRLFAEVTTHASERLDRYTA